MTGTPSRQVSRPPLLAAALWGAGSMVVAYLLCFGSLALFCINAIVITLVVRIATRAVARHRGTDLPPRWWL